MNFFGSCLYFTFRFLNLSLKLFEVILLIFSLFDISISSPGSSFKLFFCFISSSIILSFSSLFVLKVSLFLLISSIFIVFIVISSSFGYFIFSFLVFSNNSTFWFASVLSTSVSSNSFFLSRSSPHYY